MKVYEVTTGFWIFRRTHWVAKANGITMMGKTREEAIAKLRDWFGGGYYG